MCWLVQICPFMVLTGPAAALQLFAPPSAVTRRSSSIGLSLSHLKVLTLIRECSEGCQC